MASKSVQATDSPYPMKDYQCDEDVRSLQRAAEVLADKGRKNKALKAFAKQQAGGQKMMAALTGHTFKRG